MQYADNTISFFFFFFTNFIYYIIIIINQVPHWFWIMKRRRGAMGHIWYYIAIHDFALHRIWIMLYSGWPYLFFTKLLFHNNNYFHYHCYYYYSVIFQMEKAYALSWMHLISKRYSTRIPRVKWKVNECGRRNIFPLKIHRFTYCALQSILLVGEIYIVIVICIDTFKKVISPLLAYTLSKFNWLYMQFSLWTTYE